MDSGLLRAGAAMALAVGTLAIVCPAHASVITFETATGGDFSGSVTENGFTYSTLSGNLYVNEFGDPGQDMEGLAVGSGGVLDIVSATAGDFYFSSLDYAAYFAVGSGAQTLTVNGYLNGVLQGSESYVLANGSNFASLDWTLESATTSGLSGVKINDLQITLNGGVVSPYHFYQAIDNVTLFDASATPEPATWALMLAGFAGLGAMLRRRAAGMAA